jgi:hypothetical protein
MLWLAEWYLTAPGSRAVKAEPLSEAMRCAPIENAELEDSTALKAEEEAWPGFRARPMPRLRAFLVPSTALKAEKPDWFTEPAAAGETLAEVSGLVKAEATDCPMGDTLAEASRLLKAEEQDEFKGFAAAGGELVVAEASG